MKILTLYQIKEAIKNVDIIAAIEKGFIAYSNGNTITPPVGELLFNNPTGEVHIKYGYIVGDEYYIVKIASGFYENPKINLPSSNGLMLLFSQKTGALLAILIDEGYLTNLRTGAAGAIAAKYLAPPNITNIGIVGTGIQARIQLHYLQKVIQCKRVIVFGRNQNQLDKFKIDMEQAGFQIQTTQTIEDVTSFCNLIVTATSSTQPLLFAKQIAKGTHITAVGADSLHKQELDENIFGIADLIVGDSITQCVLHGDCARAVQKEIIDKQKIIELGNIISGKCHGRTNSDQITIADLTGLAVQDIQIAKTVLEEMRFGKNIADTSFL